MYGIVIWIIGWMLARSCDVAKVDVIGALEFHEENPTNTFYTLLGSNLAIDPSSFDQMKSSKSLIVSQLPKNGEAKFIENGFIYYRLTNLKAANDVFTITGKTNDGVQINEEIKVNFVNNQADLPCNSGTIGDKVKTEIGKSSEINVLANDKTCGSISNNSLIIEIQPKHGKVEVVNQKIIYTPNIDFIGDDIFFYRVGINNRKNPVAPVEINVSESSDCVKGMADDIINVLSYGLGSELVLDVLQNDKICESYNNATLKIIQNPSI